MDLKRWVYFSKRYLLHFLSDKKSPQKLFDPLVVYWEELFSFLGFSEHLNTTQTTSGPINTATTFVKSGFD